MIIWAAFKGMVVVAKKSHQQLRIKISFYTMFHLKAYFCWKVALLCWIPKRIKSSPEQISTITLYSRKTCITGRQHQPAGGGGRTSQEVWSPQKIRCSKENQTASRIWAVSVAKKEKQICNKFCLYPTLWAQLSKRKNNRENKLFDKSCLFPELYEPSFQIRKDNRAKSIFCQPCIACHSLLWEIVIKQRCPMPLKLFSPRTATISEDVYNQKKKKRMCAWLPR